MEDVKEKEVPEKHTIYSGATVPIHVLDRVILGGFSLLVLFLIGVIIFI